MKGRTECQENIAVITARADDRTQKDIICGIAEAAFATDTDVVVFSNIYNHWIRDEFLNFENVIYDFFDPSGFDGVIVTAEAFLDISTTKPRREICEVQSVDKPLDYIKMGSQGRSPRQGLGAVG